MKKKWMYYAACGLALFGLAACSSSESADDSSSDKGDGGSLVVYSPNSEGLIGATIPAFEEKYGIKVELIQAGTGEKTRVRKRSSCSRCYLWWFLYTICYPRRTL